ncbi:MAG: heme-binding protein [Dehalococcoidia bacterium]|nr:heme-binding protein [Dehalococcoidia bacterium]
MKTQQALDILVAATDAARKLGKPVTVAIVDTAGCLVALQRVNDASGFSAVVAEGKACTAAIMKRDGSEAAQLVERFPALAASMAVQTNGRFFPMQGGLLVRDEDGALGAIGVSGATGDEDEAIARAGVSAVSG